MCQEKVKHFTTLSGDPRSDSIWTPPGGRGGGHNHVQVARLPQRGGRRYPAHYTPELRTVTVYTLRTRWENWPPDGGVASRCKPRRKLVAKKSWRPAPQRASRCGAGLGIFPPPRAVITGSLFRPSSQALTPPNFFFQPESRLAGGSELEMICCFSLRC